MAEHNDVGKRGEDLATEFLVAKGYTIFDRNYNYKHDEIDIVAFKPDEIHFVEVRTRSNTVVMAPEDTIDEAKLKRIARCATFYLRERQLLSVPAFFDVVTVGLDDPENPVFRHHEDVYSGDR